MRWNRAVMIALALSMVGYASAQIFVTADPPIAIPDDSAGVITACQEINVPGSMVITYIEVEITATHTWIGDLTARLTSPMGTVLTVFNRPGRTGSGAGDSSDFGNDFPVRFTDASGTSAELMGAAPCAADEFVGSAPNCLPDNYAPAPDAADTPIAGVGTDFGDFMGEDAQGTWTLCMADSAASDLGTLTSWRLGVSNTVPVELMSFSVE